MLQFQGRQLSWNGLQLKLHTNSSRTKNSLLLDYFKAQGWICLAALLKYIWSQHPIKAHLWFSSYSTMRNCWIIRKYSIFLFGKVHFESFPLMLENMPSLTSVTEELLGGAHLTGWLLISLLSRDEHVIT